MTGWPHIALTAVLAAQADDTTATAAFGEVLEVAPVYAAVGTRVVLRQCWKERRYPGATPAGTTLVTAEPVLRRRCTRIHRVQSRREQVGYRVKYRYQGRIGQTQTERHPGRRIRVRHDLRPIHF